MHTKHYLVISGIVGGVIGSLLTALLVSPVTAQRNKFDTIQCSRLEVVDANGDAKVIIDVSGVDGKSSSLLGIYEHGGVVNVIGKDEKSQAWVSITEHGGIKRPNRERDSLPIVFFRTYGKDGVSAGLSLLKTNTGGRKSLTR